MGDSDGSIELSSQLFELYNSTGEQQHLDNAIAEVKSELAIIPHDSLDRASALHELSLMLNARYDRAEDPEDFHQAVTNAQEAVVIATAQKDPGLAVCLSHLGAMFRRRYDRTETFEDLEQAIIRGEEAVAMTPPGHTNRAPYLCDLGKSLETRYKHTTVLEDLQKAIMKLQEAVTATPHDNPGRVSYLEDLANALLKRHTHTGALDDLQQVISMLQDAITEKALSYSDRVVYLGVLVVALKMMYERTGAMEDLHQAITLGREVMEASPPGHPDRLRYSGNLVGALLSRYDCTGGMGDLEQAIVLGREAVESTPPGQPDRAWHLNALANTLLTLYERTGAVEDLQQTIIFAQEAAETAPVGHSDRPMYLSNLANALATRHERTGVIEDLQEAISLGQEAVEVTPLNHADRLAYSNNLAASLLTRYEYTGAMEDLQQAIILGQEIVETTPLDHPDRVGYLNNLANALSTRYKHVGTMEDLEQAITLGREVLEETPPDHPDRPMYLYALANVLWSRHDHTGAMDDLQQAVFLGQQALEETPLDHPDRLMYSNSLANALGVRYERTGAIEDLQQAVILSREAAEGAPLDHPERSTHLNTLSAVLSLRYELTGVVGDLQQAIILNKEAVETTPLDHPARALYLDNLTTDLRTQYERTKDLELLQQAIVHGQEAIEATPQDHYYRAERLNNLGDHIHSRYRETQSIDELNECSRCYQEAWNCLTSPPSIRIKAARNAANILAQCSRWEESSSLLEKAIRLLPKVSSRSLERDDQQYMLSALNGLAAEAASLALQAGKSGYHAVKLLELSRGIIMGFAIDCRGDLSELKSTNLELFQKFDDLRAEIDTPSLGRDRLKREREEESESRALLRRRTAINEMETTLERIRQLPGHERFQLPPSEEDLMSMAKDGPIVVFNSTIFRSDAIIITNSSIKALQLPKLAFTEASDRLGKISELTKATLRTYALKNEEMNKLFLWLWEAAVEPVLQELQFIPKPDAKVTDLPHIWWIGVGPLSRAPFHAAGDHTPKSVRNTLSHAVSSYTPTVKALSYAREKGFGLLNNPDIRLLLVTMAETPGHPALPQAKEEVEEICKLTAGSIPTTHLRQPSAIQVLEQLASYNAVHFACHGIALNKNPSDSHLILLKDDGSGAIDKLTVGDVSAAKSETAQLAYLSACSTASNPALSLADEIIHIASGFQLAGFNHVLATMWKAHTMTCKEVSIEFYRLLFGGEINCEDHRRVGMALHVAMKKARETRLRLPLRWAPFIHMGA